MKTDEPSEGCGKSCRRLETMGWGRGGGAHPFDQVRKVRGKRRGTKTRKSNS